MTKPDITTFDIPPRNAVDVLFDPPTFPGQLTDIEKELLQIKQQFAVCYLLACKENPDFSCWMDIEVLELIQKHKHLPLGECDACWREAPLQSGTFEGQPANVCAWGCRQHAENA